ncbi:MAG: hypothetical protein ACLQAT_28775 [Candidatus Binataceae bacterium]
MKTQPELKSIEGTALPQPPLKWAGVNAYAMKIFTHSFNTARAPPTVTVETTQPTPGDGAWAELETTAQPTERRKMKEKLAHIRSETESPSKTNDPGKFVHGANIETSTDLNACRTSGDGANAELKPVVDSANGAAVDPQRYLHPEDEPGEAPPPTAAEQKFAGSDEDRISVEELRIDQDFPKQAGVGEILVKVRVHKPDKQKFFRVHPDPRFRFKTKVIETREEGVIGSEIYLVHPRLHLLLKAYTSDAEIFTAIYLNSREPFLIVVKYGKRQNDWNETMLAAIKEAKTKWGQAISEDGKYTVNYAEDGALLGEPAWPENMDFERLLTIAFKDHYLKSIDHPVVKALLGRK